MTIQDVNPTADVWVRGSKPKPPTRVPIVTVILVFIFTLNTDWEQIVYSCLTNGWNMRIKRRTTDPIQIYSNRLTQTSFEQEFI